MSLNKSHMNKRAAAGAALIALSGFVPQPAMQSAQAATATISVTGSFITGITLTAGADIQFGSLAATAGAGKVVLSTAGVLTPSKAVTVGGTEKAGTIVFKAVSTTPNVDITVKGLGAVKLNNTAGGAKATGSMKVDKLSLDKFATAAVAITAVGTTDKAAAVNINKKSAKILIGATAVWAGGTTPLGTFTEALVFTMAY